MVFMEVKMFKLLLPNKQLIQAVKRTDDHVGFPTDWKPPVYNGSLKGDINTLGATPSEVMSRMEIIDNVYLEEQ